jgi:hypothetical protein
MRALKDGQEIGAVLGRRFCHHGDGYAIGVERHP